MWFTEQMMMSSATLKHRSKKTRQKLREVCFQTFLKQLWAHVEKTCRKKVTGIPDTPVTKYNSRNTLDNLGASYLR